MKTLLLVVDDKTSREFEDFCPKTKQQLTQELCLLIKKYGEAERSVRLRNLIHEINNCDESTVLNPEILLDLLPID